MLGVSPTTLRTWERRYGYPYPRRSAGGHRLYDVAELESLRTTLQETQSASSAIALARQRGAGIGSPLRLRSALGRFREDQADRLLEESLALRSLERTVEELLLVAIAELPADEAEREFAARYATSWMAAMKRLAPPATREEGVLVIDAAAPLSLDALHAQAFELMLRRAGLRTLTVSTEVGRTRLGHALRALTPGAVVLAGRDASLDVIARMVYATHSAIGSVSVYDFRGAIRHTGASTVTSLGEAPLAARDRLLGELGHSDEHRVRRSGTA